MEKLMPLKERGCSFAFNTNFLYKKDNVYLMDNHRMAAWCWAASFDPNAKYTIIHIDKHYDTLGSNLSLLTSAIGRDIKSLSLKEYNKLEFNCGLGPYKVFKWDNYIPLFHHFYADSIIEYLFFTHDVGTIPEYLKKHIQHLSVHKLIEYFPSMFIDYTDRLIINVDIDYFFVESSNFSNYLSDNATKKIVRSIMNLADDPRNIVTIALSPDCCGGWDKAEKFIAKYFSSYGINI